VGRNMHTRVLGVVWLIGIAVLAGALVRNTNAGAYIAKSGTEVRGRAPVLVELFTSEGCSSCPPADALLRKLDQTQPVGDADVIVLSEHVDYWNDIGWTDPYSAHAYSERQSDYAARFGNGSVYTPQMVVDGRFEFVGSDERKAAQAIREAVNTAKTPVELSVVRRDDKSTVVQVKVPTLASGTGSKSAEVYLALADERDESQVSRGENAGRTLEHVAVLRRFSRIGAVDASQEFSASINLTPNLKTGADARIVVIVQQPNAGQVVGVAVKRLQAE
jgi:hypothetical protein